MNNEQQSLIDKAYENYKSTILEKEIKKSAFELTVQSMSGKTFILPQEEFINKCKTDTEFSEKWKLKIEERELSLEERFEKFGLGMAVYDTVKEKEYWKTRLDETSTPTKSITITYNNKTIESYE
jgi:hypothetical protein